MTGISIHLIPLLIWGTLQQLSAAGVIQLPQPLDRAIGWYLNVHAGAVSFQLLHDTDLGYRLIQGRVGGFRKFRSGVQSLKDQISRQNAHIETLDKFENRVAALVKFYSETPKPPTSNTSINSPQYTYLPLAKDHIRLLLLAPSSEPTAPLRGYLLPTHVDQDNPYIALSYCWNDRIYSSGDGEASIFLEDLDAIPKGYHHGRPLPRKPLSLTPNLIRALRAIREDVVYKKIWVDQICINQADVDERSSQVAFMNRIYTNASYAFDLARCLGDLGLPFYKDIVSSLGLAEDSVDIASCREHGIPLLGEALGEYAALVSLICRPWFSRSWIVQEVALNNKHISVSCGPSEIPFRTLWGTYGSLSVAFAGAGNQLLVPRDLLAVLLDHRCCLSTEARDKVFAFLSVAEDTRDLGVVADYNFCARAVFTKTAAKIIRHCPNLDILSHATPWPPRDGSSGIAFGKCRDAPQRCLDGSHPHTLPGWAPDWSTMVDCRSLRPGGPAKRVINFSASGDSMHNPQFRKHDTQLGLRGLVLDQVVEVSGTFGRSLSERSAFLKDAEAMAKVKSATVYAPTGENIWDTFFKTITGGDEVLAARYGRPSYEVTEDDVARRSSTPVAAKSFRERYQIVVRTLRVAIFREKLASKLAPDSIMFTLVYNMACIMAIRSLWPGDEGSGRFAAGILGGNTNRRFVRSRRGYIGLAGPQTKPGDQIALFAGGAVPIVIREKGQPSGSTLWEIVGDAYIHGVMFGEAFDQRSCQTMWIV
ncbi:hypothetical protein ACJZ2D_012946 [Fusarium nematophilum]